MIVKIQFSAIYAGVATNEESGKRASVKVRVQFNTQIYDTTLKSRW